MEQVSNLFGSLRGSDKLPESGSILAPAGPETGQNDRFWSASGSVANAETVSFSPALPFAGTVFFSVFCGCFCVSRLTKPSAIGADALDLSPTIENRIWPFATFHTYVPAPLCIPDGVGRLVRSVSACFDMAATRRNSAISANILRDNAAPSFTQATAIGIHIRMWHRFQPRPWDRFPTCREPRRASPTQETLRVASDRFSTVGNLPHVTTSPTDLALCVRSRYG